MKLLIKFMMVLTVTLVPISNNALADDSIKDLSALQALVNTKVTSVSKKSEDPFTAPAAIYVITREDIRRSGATTIAEALRLAPGLNVAHSGSERWAISSRGFNDETSNKLLVLVDGRTVYSPLYSGVDWESINTLIEDIKQIEVIRGPGATLWGANAVNGVINIITEEAVNTMEKSLTVTAGNRETIESARTGGKIGQDIHYRIYAKHSNTDATKAVTGGNVNDAWSMLQSGFRMDWDRTSKDLITLQGDIYDGRLDRTAFLPILTPPFMQQVTDNNPVAGGNILNRMTHTYDDGSTYVLQTYVDHSERDFSVSKESISTFDTDFQRTFNLSKAHELTWGAEYRVISNDEAARFYFYYNIRMRTDNLFATFLQDKYMIVPNKLALTLGSKLEHNDYTGFEVEPNIRLAYTPTESQTIWGAISRAVRTPSRAESDVQIRISDIPGAGYVTLVGSKNYASEDLVAYELGYRIRPTSKLSVDTTAFYNHYNNLRTFEAGMPSGDTALPLLISNNGRGQSVGGELATTYNVTNKWQLTGTYSYIDLATQLKPGNTSILASEPPKNQFSFRSHMNLPHEVEVDNILYYVDDLASISIPAYERFDTRIAWKPLKNVELSLVGQNLFNSYHKEFIPRPVLEQSEIGREFYGQINLRF